MARWRLDEKLVTACYRRSQADRWSLSVSAFAAGLERSVERFFADRTPDARAIAQYLDGLHLDDLALACACAEGLEPAWDHFVREYRPVLYRAADAIDPGGGARDLADSLYGELFGLSEHEGRRRSHFVYFHGRSQLGTWLRAVLSQRHVDRLRGVRRLDPLPSDEAPDAIVSRDEAADPFWPRSVALIQKAVSSAVATLSARDRLRLSCYYAQELTLAQIGRALGEHEATVSRQLARARRAVREHVERHLRERERMSEAEITECFRLAIENSGPLDVADLLGRVPTRKETVPERSQ